MSKYKRVKCPTCNSSKSKSAISCMPCYLKGLGEKRKGYMKNPRKDEELRMRMRVVIEKLSEESKIPIKPRRNI